MSFRKSIKNISFHLASVVGVSTSAGESRVMKGLGCVALPAINGLGGSAYDRKYLENICLILRAMKSSLSGLRENKPLRNYEREGERGREKGKRREEK